MVEGVLVGKLGRAFTTYKFTAHHTDRTPHPRALSRSRLASFGWTQFSFSPQIPRTVKNTEFILSSLISCVTTQVILTPFRTFIYLYFYPPLALRTPSFLPRISLLSPPRSNLSSILYSESRHYSSTRSSPLPYAARVRRPRGGSLHRRQGAVVPPVRQRRLDKGPAVLRHHWAFSPHVKLNSPASPSHPRLCKWWRQKSPPAGPGLLARGVVVSADWRAVTPSF